LRSHGKRSTGSEAAVADRVDNRISMSSNTLTREDVNRIFFLIMVSLVMPNLKAPYQIFKR
jgi:hypothetical protein